MAYYKEIIGKASDILLNLWNFAVILNSLSEIVLY